MADTHTPAFLNVTVKRLIFFAFVLFLQYLLPHPAPYVKFFYDMSVDRFYKTETSLERSKTVCKRWKKLIFKGHSFLACLISWNMYLLWRSSHTYECLYNTLIRATFAIDCRITVFLEAVFYIASLLRNKL